MLERHAHAYISMAPQHLAIRRRWVPCLCTHKHALASYDYVLLV